MEMLVIVERLVITFAISMIFGIERQISLKPIGFGTFTFVAIGSCGLAITASVLEVENPIPLLATIITGIGFLGAGALIRTTEKIFGFTSAAGIWIFAIIWLIIGSGFLLIGLVIYVLVWAVIFIDKILEMKKVGVYQKKIVIVSKEPQSKDKIMDLLETTKIKIFRMFPFYSHRKY
jgi:putative Mg2+ transporter-C (MgtC) family protein